MTNVEQPSYFNARESIIPRLPETPIKKSIVVKRSDVEPSKIIKIETPPPITEPLKIEIKPAEVAPPKKHVLISIKN